MKVIRRRLCGDYIGYSPQILRRIGLPSKEAEALPQRTSTDATFVSTELTPPTPRMIAAWNQT